MTRGQVQSMEPTSQPNAILPSDEDLLQRIARARDQVAFEELTHRFSKLAYNLALHLTCNASMAEDAVQEAMVEVWLHASQFNPIRGRARNWLFCIVANKTRTLRTREGRERIRVMTKRSDLRLDSMGKSLETSDTAEMNSALHQMLGSLSVIERKIVSLYYGADLSQDEIGRVLDVPQTTVSLKLREALAKLRAGLTTAGFASAVPLLEAGHLGDALLSQEATPPGLHARIMKGLSSVARRSARTMATSSSGWALGIGAVILVMVASGVGLLALFGARTPDPHRINAVPPSPGATGKPDNPARVSQTPERLAWTFDSAIDADQWEVIQGSWVWDPHAGTNGTGAMRIRDMALVSVGAHLPSGNYLLSFEVANQDVRQISAGACWEREGPSVILNDLLISSPIPAHAEWDHVDIFVNDEFRMAKRGEGLRWLVFAKRGTEARLSLSLVGQMCIDDISIVRLPSEEFPDVQVYRTLMNGIPEIERRGSIIRQHPDAANNERPVRITFKAARDYRKE